MDKDRKSHLASIDNSVLSRVAGGEDVFDVWDSWSWYFASQSCKNEVIDAMGRAGQDAGGSNVDVWAAANQAGLDAWNGRACSFWGWF